MNRLMGVKRVLSRIDWRLIERVGAVALIAAFLVRDLLMSRAVAATQPLGMDFLPLWTGARVDPDRLYDFAYVTAQQAWLYVGQSRPFVYPPSALLVLKPFGLLPFWAALVAFMGLTAALLAWAARRLGADWRVLLITPPVVLVALAGQVTFLVGALVTAAVTFANRPLLAGALFGVAGAIKPQMLVLLPLALAVARDWRAFWATAAAAALMVLASLAIGADWSAWAAALPRFQQVVASNPGLVRTSLTPYAHWGAISLVLTVPVAVGVVWLAFRRGNPAQRALALLGGALLVTPYAMNYEIALLVPAVLALWGLRLWTLPFWLAVMFYPNGPTTLAVAMAMLVVSLILPTLGAPREVR